MFVPEPADELLVTLCDALLHLSCSLQAKTLYHDLHLRIPQVRPHDEFDYDTDLPSIWAFIHVVSRCYHNGKP